MKKSELKEIIREVINSVLAEGRKSGKQEKAMITLKPNHSVNSFHDKVKAVKDTLGWRLDAKGAVWIPDEDIKKIEPIN